MEIFKDFVFFIYSFFFFFIFSIFSFFLFSLFSFVMLFHIFVFSDAKNGENSRNVPDFWARCKVTLPLSCFSLFLFSVVRADAKTGKNPRTVPLVKMTISFCENSIFEPRWTRVEGSEWPFEGDLAFMFFISLVSFFIFFAKKCVSSFSCFSLHVCFIASISIRF